MGLKAEIEAFPAPAGGQIPPPDSHAVCTRFALMFTYGLIACHLWVYRDLITNACRDAFRRLWKCLSQSGGPIPLEWRVGDRDVRIKLVTTLLSLGMHVFIVTLTCMALVGEAYFDSVDIGFLVKFSSAIGFYLVCVAVSHGVIPLTVRTMNVGLAGILCMFVVNIAVMLNLDVAENMSRASSSGESSVSFESGGGVLHGSWVSGSPALASSDRRLKQEIIPLQRTLRDVMFRAEVPPPSANGKAAPSSTRSTGSAAKHGGADGALWVLRELRPVSYSLKRSVESKYMRFGFIAQELECVVPQVVRSVGTQELSDPKGVLYQDLIALLASAAQSLALANQAQQQRMDALAVGMEELRLKLYSIEVTEQAVVQELRDALASERRALTELKEKVKVAVGRK